MDFELPPVKIGLTAEDIEPFQFQRVEGGDPRTDLADDVREHIVVDTIHDGWVLPMEFRVDGDGNPIPEELIRNSYNSERDWGASLVAARIAWRLNLGGYYRVNIARSLLDFGRFPGVTEQGAPHLRRFAVNHPFSEFLSFGQKKSLLERYYDRISDRFDAALDGVTLKIAIHTYDRLNASGTARPQVSLVTRTLGYQLESEMPLGVFDPMYPDVLAEFTVDRILRDRISLTLEKQGIPVAHNYPYLLPEGSTEVRYQVWSFFDFLQRRFENANPATRGMSEFAWVWRMLKDTNLRAAEAGTLRSYLHMLRRAPRGREREFMRAERAYRRIEAFLHQGNDAIVEDYRFQEGRPSSLGIEVRKDLAWHFAPDGTPLGPNIPSAIRVADVISDAVLIYLREDVRTKVSRSERLEQSSAWYHGTDFSVS